MPPQSERLTLNNKSHRRVIAELERRLAAAGTLLSLPRPLLAALNHILLPEEFDRPKRSEGQKALPPVPPSKAPAGSSERIATMRARVLAGKSVFDGRDGGSCSLPPSARRGHSLEEIAAIFREPPTPDAPEVSSVEELLLSWTDVLGRAPECLGRTAEKEARRRQQAQEGERAALRVAHQLRSELASLRGRVRKTDRLEKRCGVLQSRLKASQSQARLASRLDARVAALKAELQTTKTELRTAKKAAEAGGARAVPYKLKRSYSPPPLHPSLPFMLDTTDAQDDDGRDGVESPLWANSTGRLYAAVS